MEPNQTPEQLARDRIDKKLRQVGWNIQSQNSINFNTGLGIAIREYQTDVGPADYVLLVDRIPVGIIEAKRDEEGHRLTTHEEQAENYAKSKLKYFENQPLPFVYESTGDLTRFTDLNDPKPRSRPVFTFHTPETFKEWIKQEKTLRARLLEIPALSITGLRDCQINAITQLEDSFKNNRPRALIQMATGSGKTYTAITFIYRLLKFAKAKRILFLVDTKNLGEQAEQEFMSYVPNDDNRKFTELYTVQRLKSRYVAPDSQVCISTIQRLYSILKGEELDEKAEVQNPNESWHPKEPLPVVYNDKVPMEFFDFILIDEAHRSIYNLWKQVLEYYDAFLIGLTATPDQRTFGFFNENVVSEYSHEDAVADGVNVGFDVFTIETKITKKGSKIVAEEFVEKREKLSRKKRWEQLDEDLEYSSKELDKEVVNPSQIRNIIKTFRDKLTEIFPGREEVPKTLIFAKTDSHADDIIQIVREEFSESNDFCKKITYNATEDPKSLLAQFRNSYNPRIAVTVDMIATGTDVKPLECLLFMRDVKSKNYFEQMKGRGTRTIVHDDLKKVSPSAHLPKTHFVIVDAIGVTKSVKTDSRPLERKKTIPLKDLLGTILMGTGWSEDVFLSVASRLSRLEKQITDKEKVEFEKLSGGKTIHKVVHELLNAFNPDKIEDKARTDFDVGAGQTPTEDQLNQAQSDLLKQAGSTFTGQLNEYIENVRKAHEQTIDTTNIDQVEFAGWDKSAKETVEELIEDFKTFCEKYKDEITALKIFYNQPYRRREITYSMIKDVLEKLKTEKPALAPLNVWQAYEQIEKVNGKSPKNELIALVSLIRRVTGLDEILTAYDQVVSSNFKKWVFQKQAGASVKFNEKQMEWLRMIRDHIAVSINFTQDDLDYAPFDSKGGIGKMYQLFGSDMGALIHEMGEALAS